MNTTNIPSAFRYTPKHHQHILWDGSGLYKWCPDKEMWIKLTPEQWEDFVYHDGNRRGLYLAFTLENTTAT